MADICPKPNTSSLEIPANNQQGCVSHRTIFTIDAHLTVAPPIQDIASVLQGLTAYRVKVRNGGATQIWEHGSNGWNMREPTDSGKALFDSFHPDFVEFSGRVVRFGSCCSYSSDRKRLLLSTEDGYAFLAHMQNYPYMLEDAIAGRSVDGCALALFSVADLKKVLVEDSPWGKKVIKWLARERKAGADEVRIRILFDRKTALHMGLGRKDF